MTAGSLSPQVGTAFIPKDSLVTTPCWVPCFDPHPNGYVGLREIQEVCPTIFPGVDSDSIPFRPSFFSKTDRHLRGDFCGFLEGSLERMGKFPLEQHVEFFGRHRERSRLRAPDVFQPMVSTT